MPTYSVPSDLATLDPAVLAAKLRGVLALAKTTLEGLRSPDVPPAGGKWSAKQIVGHLCDSAMNNQQRIVRLQLAPTLTMPAYEQEAWVRVQRYDLRTWAEVTGLFFALNDHLAHTVSLIEPGTFGHTWMLGGVPLTLGFIVEDYIGHLEHHLKGLKADS